jgi:hypothetical protein
MVFPSTQPTWQDFVNRRTVKAWNICTLELTETLDTHTLTSDIAFKQKKKLAFATSWGRLLKK